MLFHSDFFKAALYARVKNPAELVVGAVRTAGGHRFPQVEDIDLGLQTGVMGQRLLDPPSVEGWHTGSEWINTASLMARVNFAADQFADASLPGVRDIVNRVMNQEADQSPDSLVDACLDLVGPMTLADSTRETLREHAAECLQARQRAENLGEARIGDILQMLQLIVATREYQLA